MSWIDTFVSYDTETTGLDKTARIIEVAFVRFEEGQVKERWESFINPGEVKWDDPNVQKALEVNQIKQEDLKDAPSFMDIFHHVAAHLRGVDVWVAHNAEFDLRMFDQEYRAHRGMPFPITLPRLNLCTKLLSSRINPTERSHSLAPTAARWGVEQDGAHRAASDAITCGRILYAMHQKNALPLEVPEVEEFHKQASVAWNSRFNKGRR